MNDQPNPSEFKFKNSGPQPSTPSGLRHLAPWMKTLATGGVLATLLMYGAQMLPDRFRPSSVAGNAAGDAVRHEIEAMREAKIDMDRRTADATAQANAKAQADLLVQTKILEERTASLAPVSAMAGLADFACLGSQVVAGLTQPQGWNRQSGDDLYSIAQRTGAATCGIGNSLRQGVTESQIESISTAAAARGAPMTDGSVQTVSKAGIQQRALDTIDAITKPSKHYDYADVQKVQKWADQLPDVVRQHLRANLPSNNSGWDVFVDRARALDAVFHPA